ncbi:Calmodulin-binding receptor-like cytoplasmic kinase 2 [Dendrobium catenatum]|uniref:Calmodulin-binding receptor-like cytoplasmic kinase 2 n=1 Tax=Dendrobium catenatum TaxID=906689 RepID=A0A2I0X685_9ASPA|nr:Calmodulin-binding receptor-like cytoplasmic kinase 2 [Dendrobium catenatum]
MEFQTEIKTLARVEHFNLVRFIGYVEQDGEKVVVVEYVPNGTLRDHLDCEFYGIPLILKLLCLF